MAICGQGRILQRLAGPLSKIRSLAIEGTIASADGRAGTYTLDVKAPNRYYSELVVDLRDYTWRPSDCFHVGKQVTLENFGGLYLCLELYRENDTPVYGALVYLWRRRANLAVDMWDRLNAAASNTAYCEGNDLFFERLLSEDEIPDFLDHLNRALDDFIAFIGGCGGLRKFLPQQS